MIGRDAMHLPVLSSFHLLSLFLLLLLHDVITTSNATSLTQYESRERDIRGIFGQRIIKSVPTASSARPSYASATTSYSNQTQTSNPERGRLQQSIPISMQANKAESGINIREFNKTTNGERIGAIDDATGSTSMQPFLMSEHENADQEKSREAGEAVQEEDDDAEEFGLNPAAAYRLHQKDDDSDDGDVVEAHDSDHHITYMDQRGRRGNRNPEAGGMRRGIEEDYEFLIPSSRSSSYPRSGIPPPSPSISNGRSSGPYFPIDLHEKRERDSNHDDVVLPYNIHRQIDPSIRLILNHKALSMFLITNQRIMDSKVRRSQNRKWHRIRYVDLESARKLQQQPAKPYHKWRQNTIHQYHGYNTDWSNLIR